MRRIILGPNRGQCDCVLSGIDTGAHTPIDKARPYMNGVFLELDLSETAPARRQHDTEDAAYATRSADE